MRGLKDFSLSKMKSLKGISGRITPVNHQWPDFGLGSNQRFDGGGDPTTVLHVTCSKVWNQNRYKSDIQPSYPHVSM